MEIYNFTCQECGCHCKSCKNNNRPICANVVMETGFMKSLHLHQEIEDLKKRLIDRENCILQMETNVIIEANKYPNGQYFAIREELGYWQEKYDRLYESHKKLQKVNQGLEDKLLKIVDKYETEKSALTKDIAELTNRLVEARVTITELEEENEQYRNDCNLAVQLLQCKPSNFVSHRIDTLPVELQHKVKHHINQKRRDFSCNQKNVPDVRTIRVPIPTFPPTAMVYSVNTKLVQTSDNEDAANAKRNDVVSAAIMAKVLEERAKEHKLKSSPVCVCKTKHRKDKSNNDKETQTNSVDLGITTYDPENNGTWNILSTNYVYNPRTRTESCSSYELNTGRCWSRTGSSSSGTETQI